MPYTGFAMVIREQNFDRKFYSIDIYYGLSRVKKLELKLRNMSMKVNIMKSISELLSEAATLGEKVGVIKDRYKTNDGMCIKGLLATVIALDAGVYVDARDFDRITSHSSRGDSLNDIYLKMVPFIQSEFPESYSSGDIAEWNNSPDSTGLDMINALKRAADRAKNELLPAS